MCTAARIEQQLEALHHENAVLAMALAKAQTRNTEQGQVHASKLETLNKELVRLRAELIWRDTMIATLQEARQQASLELYVAVSEQQLEDCTVLCVGARASAVPVYRQLIEKMGGRFLHHDGGNEDNVARLDHTLAAADLVICQTGCISHDAYWRVKTHCKRTGKECMYVDNPSAHSLFKGLEQVRMDVRVPIQPMPTPPGK